jgi:hypothetical protein
MGKVCIYLRILENEIPYRICCYRSADYIFFHLHMIDFRQKRDSIIALLRKRAGVHITS